MSEETPNTNPISPKPVYFDATERPLFGWVHQPAERCSRGTVVLCPPLAREYLNAHYPYRLLAESLARHSITAIRFDYPGTDRARWPSSA